MHHECRRKRLHGDDMSAQEDPAVVRLPSEPGGRVGREFPYVCVEEVGAEDDLLQGCAVVGYDDWSSEGVGGGCGLGETVYGDCGVVQVG